MFKKFHEKSKEIIFCNSYRTHLLFPFILESMTWKNLKSSGPLISLEQHECFVSSFNYYLGIELVVYGNLLLNLTGRYVLLT